MDGKPLRGGWRRAAVRASERREQAIKLALAGQSSVAEICEQIGISRSGYEQWRHRHADFRERFDAARAQARARKSERYDGSFVSFRKHYLGMETTWFQAMAAEAIEQAQPGEVVLILWPPEHGKTTLIEDWSTYKLVDNPHFRITVASATDGHPIKMLARVKARLEPDGPTPQIAADFGPFAPADDRRYRQVWAAKAFNVAGKRQTDERDYSMRAIGITGSVQGTRCDLMLIDDVQSLKNLELTPKLYEIIVQDFLSRPSVFGRTVIVGTRVGEQDVYRRLIDEGVVDRLVKFPAYDPVRSPVWPAPAKKPQRDDPETLPPPGVEWLWPERYSEYDYAALRYRVKEAAWARNYMQYPEAASKMTFPEEVTSMMHDDQRSVIADPELLAGGNLLPVVLSLDPSIGGGNAVGAWGLRPDRMELLHCRLDYDLTNYGQVFDLLDEYCWRFSTTTSKVIEIVIEDKAFQKGLLRDDRLVEMQNRWGFRAVPNTTGREKTDPDIGVPAMPESIRRGEITIPWADDVSREVCRPLLDHLHIWRPGVNGVKLPQDMTMMMWFAWRRWRAQRDTPLHRAPDMSQFCGRPSPLRHTHRPAAARRRPGVARYR